MRAWKTLRVRPQVVQTLNPIPSRSHSASYSITLKSPDRSNAFQRLQPWRTGKLFATSRTITTETEKQQHDEILQKAYTHGNAYVCPDCQRRFPSPGVLRNHKRNCSPVEAVCEHCRQTFTNKESLWHHLRNICPHRRVAQTLHECTACKRGYKSQLSLERHKCPGREIKCDVCDATFLSEKSLARHSELHDPERPHACHLCANRYIQLMHLRRHQLAQHKIDSPRWKKNTCKICNERFTHPYLYDAHMRKVHGKAHLQCNRCDFETPYTQAMHNHMRLHDTLDKQQSSATGDSTPDAAT
ncbi:hypothetical protein M8818_005706 [Zalaria obscura]|uniref:Uncharacterized protein n=1 Tax=Zalaria obscura TaxID=2024903 RepID=A0ACC3SBV3_9PEZI